jgi:type IV secretion system protein TrbE
MPYHWSTRFVFLDTLSAQRQINKKRRNWRQQWHKLGGKAAEAMHGEESGNLQLHPVQMTHDALEAAAEAASGDVIYGYYTMTVTVFSARPSNCRGLCSERRFLYPKIWIPAAESRA